MRASIVMQQVVEELAVKHGVDLSVPGAWMRLEMPHFDRLVVECIGRNRISVGHYFTLNGDLIPAPEIVFAVEANGWCAVSVDHGMGMSSTVAHLKDGRWHGDRHEQAGAAQFADEWAGNIRDQGWIEQGQFTRVDRGDGRKAA